MTKTTVVIIAALTYGVMGAISILVGATIDHFQDQRAPDAYESFVSKDCADGNLYWTYMGHDDNEYTFKIEDAKSCKNS